MRLKFYYGPRDRSLQAFKDWMRGKNYLLRPNARETVIEKQWIDDAQWVDNWKQFWEKVDSASKSHKSGDQ